MSRDIARPVTKTPRLTVDQPFRQELSGEQTRTRCVKDVSCKHTDSGKTNVKSFRGSPQFPSRLRKVEIDRICTISNPVSGRAKEFCFKVGKIAEYCLILT